MQQGCLTRKDRNARDHAYRPRPFSHKHTGLASSPNLARIGLFCEGKRKSSDSLAGICMKQARGGGGWGPLTCLFARSHNTASMPLLCRGPTTHPLCPIFGYAKKPILNGNFPRKFHQSRATPKDVIRN